MFSGIVEEMATVVALRHDGGNVDLTLTCSFTSQLKIDQSVSHNGVCLTVVAIDGDNYTVTAMRETLDRSNLGLLQVGDKVNVERSMMMNGRLDGHIVPISFKATSTALPAARPRRMPTAAPTLPSPTTSTARWHCADISPSTKAA